MSLLTERGTGFGSRLGNVTVRAWIVLFVVLTGCVNATLITAVQLYCAFKALPIPDVQLERVLENVIFVVIGWYFNKQDASKLQPKTDKD